jgi:deazaflavin-dependent oxidoreductase (nitroreductase family)
MANDPATGKNDHMAKSYRLGPARRAVNSLMTSMIRMGIGGKSNYLLTTTGRKSGQARTTPVTVLRDAGDRWLISPYGAVGWVHNVRANPEVSLRRGRTTEVLRAAEADPETAGPLLQRYVRAVPITAPFFDAKAADPVQKFVDEAARHPVFQLTSKVGPVSPAGDGQ